MISGDAGRVDEVRVAALARLLAVRPLGVVIGSANQLDVRRRAGSSGLC